MHAVKDKNFAQLGESGVLTAALATMEFGGE